MTFDLLECYLILSRFKRALTDASCTGPSFINVLNGNRSGESEEAGSEGVFIRRLPSIVELKRTTA